MVCEVSIAGEKVGYISDKQKFEAKLNEIINKEEKAKLYTVIENMPEYKFTLVDKSEQTNEEIILAKLKENAETTYKLYAVTLDGEEKAILADLKEAEKIVDDMTEKYKDDIDLDIGITEVITTTKDKENTVKVATADLNGEIEKKIEEIEKEIAIQKEIESHTVEGIYLEVTPVSGIITSRFGSMESIRSSSHKGLDIAAPYGTPIKATADGTVVYSAYCDGYGYLVQISHGNGIETYYGHCSSLYVSEGEKVEAGDIIAAVGSTGNSTGNHLHFEIRVNDEQIDPQNYLYN